MNFLSVWIVSMLCCMLVRPESFESFKEKMETKVKGLADKMTEYYGRRCDDNIVQCEIKSYNQCEGTDEKICYDDFPRPVDCVSGGAFLSTTSATRFPNDVNTDSLGEEERLFVCTSAMLEPDFEDLNDGRNSQYGKAYIGTTLGSFRSYPTSLNYDEDGKCADYDPRFRPWYVTATSGGKNVVLVIDTSGSMDGSRMEIAKEAGKSVINTLSNNDFVGVINFDSSVSTLHSSKIIRATSQDKEAIIQKIDELEPSGMTNYEVALRKAITMISSASSDEFGAPCRNAQNIILFLTDGEPTSGESTSAGLISIINSYGIDITLFTYGLGSGIDSTLLKDLSCEYNGITFLISDSASKSELTTTMRSYYIYISEGITLTNPVWTEPYDDAFGFGRMVTVSMPIYYEESGIRKILGAAGIDVTMKTFEEFGFSIDEEGEKEITKKLISNMPCLSSSLTPCDLQNLRSSSLKCGEVGCTSGGSIVACPVAPPTNIFLTPTETGDYICCGLTIGGLVGILVSIVVVIAVVVGVICYKLRKKRLEEQEFAAANQQ